MHIVVGVSRSGWATASTTRRVHVHRLLEFAVEWANAELGGAFAARYDVDEKGVVIDVFCAPVREYTVCRGRTMRRTVAPATALREWAKRRKALTEGIEAELAKERSATPHVRTDGLGGFGGR